MQTRREQLQAYQFLVRRILAALLGNEPEAPEQPMRRAKVATFSGVMVGALACGAVALVGFLTNSSSQGWQDNLNKIIVDKTTKQHFYYAERNGQKTLFPIANRTSAQLFLGKPELETVDVPSENLDGFPRGQEAGIPDVPGALPTAENITAGPWLVCNHMPNENERRVDLFVDRQPPKGSTNLTDDRAVIINDDGNQLYLVWRDTRFAVDAKMLNNLSIDPTSSIRVAPAWLNLLPQGEDLVARPPTGFGNQPGVEIDGKSTLVGQVFYTTSSDTYWVMLSDGLVRTTETQARLLLGAGAASPDGVQTEAETTTLPSANDAEDTSQPALVPEGQPEALPTAIKPAGPRVPLCLTYDGDPDAPLTISVNGDVPRTDSQQATTGQPTGLPASGVSVTGGEAAVIATLGGDGKPSGWAVVADSGLKYPVPSKSVLSSFGYEKAPTMRLPKAFADLVQAGPALDPDSARLAALR